MTAVHVGMADCQVSKDQDTMLITSALGSCIAVLLHDPQARVAGLLHYMLPEAGLDPAKAAERPYMFADTGIPLLFRRAYELGAQKRRLRVWAAGAANVMDPNGLFQIGHRNQLAMRRILWRSGVIVEGTDLGGSLSRSVMLEVASGRLLLRTGGMNRWQAFPAGPNAGMGAAR